MSQTFFDNDWFFCERLGLKDDFLAKPCWWISAKVPASWCKQRWRPAKGEGFEGWKPWSTHSRCYRVSPWYIIITYYNYIYGIFSSACRHEHRSYKKHPLSSRQRGSGIDVEVWHFECECMSCLLLLEKVIRCNDFAMSTWVFRWTLGGAWSWVVQDTVATTLVGELAIWSCSVNPVDMLKASLF